MLLRHAVAADAAESLNPRAAALTLGMGGQQQGGRVATGLGPVGMMAGLTTLLRPLVKKPPMTYIEAMGHIHSAGFIPDALEFAEIALETAKDQCEYGTLRGDPLPIDGIAFIMTYTAEATHPPLYRDMNDKCCSADRMKAAPYGPFIVATVKHMAEIEPYPNETVFRGVKADLRAEYPKGRKVTWHGFCSTSKSAGVLSNPNFCGESGERTIFAIKLTQGQAREITRYSLVSSEDEVLLPPGCRFEVESVLPQGDLTLVQLIELPSREWIMDLSKVGAEEVAASGRCSGGEQIALLQRKLVQSTQTLRELQAMGVCWTELEHKVAQYQVELAGLTEGAGGDGATDPRLATKQGTEQNSDHVDAKKTRQALGQVPKVTNIQPIGHKLFNAALRGQLEVTRGLIEEGASIEWTNAGYNGMRALHVACYHGHGEVVQLLVASSAEVNALDSYQRTPLHRAAASGHMAVCHLLLDSGADTTPKTKDGSGHMGSKMNGATRCRGAARLY